MSPPLEPRHIDSRLRAETRRLVRRIQAARLHARSARAWLTCAAVALAVLALAWLLAWPAAAPVAGIAAAFVACGWLVARWWQVPVNDYGRAADLIENAYPELGHALRTALEQRPDDAGRYSFLQKRLLDEVLSHARRHFWSRSPVPAARRAALAHGAALLAACCLAVLATRYTPPARPPAPPSPETIAAGLEILPGDAEVERGTTVVVTARFGDGVPAEARLSWRTSDGAVHAAAMTRSLADPVFASTLPHVEADLDYTVEFGGATSRAHRITVFDLPRMVRGDASLEYPAFTGLQPRTTEDTRRISAVEGSRLTYELHANKPLREAHLRAADGASVPLTALDETRTRFGFSMPVEQSVRYSIHLSDEAGRTNPDPPDLRIEALPNRRPELKVAFPRGDQRVSPIEEVALEASAADDFGLLDYGIAWSVAGAEPLYVSAHDAADAPPRQASFQRLLALESLGVEPAQLVTWFAWADDTASDGTRRRTRGDLYFAEVRAFDEVFREGEGEARPQQGTGGAGDTAGQLLEMQRDISLAIWKLRDAPTRSDAFHQDVSTVLGAQHAVQRLLAEASAELTEPTMQASAAEAGRQMERCADRLDESREESSAEPLAPSWSASQAAYQALLRMQPSESQVGRERNSSGGSRGGRGGQRQLDQLRFKDAADRYEMESEAQLSSTPEQREEMQTLARLRELARRQSDLNDRLQELQTALQAAADEAARDEIRRELRRLEEEQRRMLSDVDDLRQRMDQQAPGSRTAESREQVERTREDMRRAGDALQEGEISQALASGTRAEENLEQAREQLRESSAGEFSDEMRELRREARDLAESQAGTERLLTETARRAAPSLDDSADRAGLAEALDRNRDALAELTRQLRHVTEESEHSEPALHRQLYDLLREQAQRGGTEDRMDTASELLRRGFTDEAVELQPQITQALDRLARGVERAAESVLGGDDETMRFAQAELDDLTRSLRDTAPAAEGAAGGGDHGEPSRQREATGEDSGRTVEDSLEGALAELGRSGPSGAGARGDNPITGEGFADWEARLRTVEALLDEPEARDRVAQARQAAADLRREFRRHASPPLQTTIDSGIIAPLGEVRAWLRQELARRDDPNSLQPIDRDPVPEVYAESVRRYYEALGE